MSFELLFPVPFLVGFTTATTLQSLPTDILPIDLASKQLGAAKWKAPTETVSKNGVQAWEAYYPKGSINPKGTIKGGFGFYLTGPSDNAWAKRFETAKEVTFGYSVCFDNGFDWAKGGKLPGICEFLCAFTNEIV